MRKKIIATSIATGGMVTSLFLASAGSALAQTSPAPITRGMVMGMGADAFPEDLKSDRSYKHMLQEQGIPEHHIQKITKHKNNHISKKASEREWH